MLKAKLPIALLLTAVLFLTVLPSSASAELEVTNETSLKDRIITNIKDFFHLDNKKLSSELSVSSNIKFAPAGDLTRNGQIDAGDTIRFLYTIKNPSDKNLTFISLNTHINRKTLSYIHNIKGTASLDDDGKNIIVPYLNIPAGQKLDVYFDANVKNFKEQNRVITTQPEIFDSQKKSLTRSEKKEVTPVKRENENNEPELKIKYNKK